MKFIQSLIPFLADYPFWVKGFFSLWVICTAVLVLCLLFVPRTSALPANSNASEVADSAPHNADPFPVNRLPSQSATPDTPAAVRHVPIPENFAPVTAEKVLSSLKDKELTELQKKQFMDTYRGRIVRWNVVVLDVKSNLSSNMLLVFRPAADQSRQPEILVASFSLAHEKDLLSLKKGQSIVIDGVLDFLSTGTGPSPSLKDAKLVQVGE